MRISSLLDPEPETMKAFSPSLGDVVVDVGAYVGRYTLKAAKSVGNEGIVVAIEPEPNAYRVLLQNLKLNRVKNVRPIKIVLSNYDGICKLYSLGPGWDSLMKKSKKANVVPCKTLDTLLEELNVKNVDWVKVDVEGAEYRVLQGMTKTLRKNRQIKCVFEIHYNICEAKNVEPKLEKMGFRVLRIDSGHILAFRPNARL